MVYKIGILVVGPSHWVTIVSELSLCGVFHHMVVQLGSREKGNSLRFHLTSVRMYKMKNSGTTDAGEDVEKEENFSIVGGIASW